MKRIVPVVVGLMLLLAACGGNSSNGTQEGGTSSPSGQTSGDLVVFGAASLTEAFGEMGKAFEQAHPGTTVTFNFGPSDGLAQQIESEGGADVFASASPKWMDSVQNDGPGVTERANFARNRPIIITPGDNPAYIRSLDDLADPGVKLVLAAEGVPIGDYAREILANAGIAKQALANVVSNEEDVKAVVQKVLAGEADAGIVYRTDMTKDVQPQVQSIAIPENVNVIATYPIAVVDGSKQGNLASAFVDYVLGAQGQATLRSFGFRPAS